MRVQYVIVECDGMIGYREGRGETWHVAMVRVGHEAVCSRHMAYSSKVLTVAKHVSCAMYPNSKCKWCCYILMVRVSMCASCA
jgi:hypothetical protein